MDFIEGFIFSEPGLYIASRTEVLLPNSQRSFNLKINEYGSGLFGLANSNDPESIQGYYGKFTIRAKFIVADFNLPTGGDVKNIFRGAVFSMPVTVYVKS